MQLIEKHLLHITVICSLLLLSYRCGTNEPKLVEEKDEKEYIWDIDTLTYPTIFQMLLSNFWGTDCNNLFAVGHNADNYRNMWRWDGRNWSIFKPQPRDIYENILDVEDISGIDTNNIWIVGSQEFSPFDKSDSSVIVYYNGYSWNKEEIKLRLSLTDIVVNSNYDIYAAGLGGGLYHYDGIKWELISNDTTIDFGSIAIRTNNSNSDEAYCLGRKIIPNLPDIYWKYYFIKINLTGYTILDSTTENEMKFGISGLWLTDQSIYTFGRGIFKKEKESWVKIFSSSRIIGCVKGNSDDEIYAAEFGGKIYYFDGSQWNQMKHNLSISSKTWLTDMFICNEEIFVLAHDDYQTFVYHFFAK